MLTPGLLDKYVRQRGAFLYHLTDFDNVPSILRQGICSRPSRSQFAPRLIRQGHAYLCARRIAWRSYDGTFDCSWGDAVLRVRLDRLDPQLINADEEYWRGGELAGGSIVEADVRSLLKAFPKMDEPDLVYSCLLHFGSIAYAGKIPPQYLDLCAPSRLGKLRRKPRLRELPHHYNKR